MKTLIAIFLSLPLFLQSQTNPQDLKLSMEKIVLRDGFRNHTDTLTLNAVAEYIFNEFATTGHQPVYQEFFVNEVKYKNVILRIGSKDLPTIVIGAHYDVCGEQQGADDNASGLVGLIEVAKQLKNFSGKHCLEFVAYTLEEPPYFATKAMGSYIHADNLIYDKRAVFGMISLEMLGYFSDEPNSQEYPINMMRWFYGDKADYIFITKKMFNGKFVRQFSKNYMNSKLIKTKKLGAPKSIAGIDFSDHRNYWHFGIDALMLTDTSFYRNKNYHKATDTLDTLDFVRMAKVVDALVVALKKL